jgi:DNA polymerase I
MARNPDLVLVDGSSYVYRGFHALRTQLTTSRGEPTGAMLVVMNMLLKLIKDYQPRHLAVVFDAPGRTFRDEIFAEYKAHRPGMPDDLRSQIEPLLQIIRAQGIPVLRIPGVEADDVIGTLARRAARAGQTVLISTGDKDMAQLVDGSITLINTMTNTVLDREAVKLKFDVYPEQIVDYLALVGDTSDNIPGIEKVGPKTGAKLLQQYCGLDELIGRVAEVPGKVGENLRAGLATLELSRRLATIRTDLDVPLSIEELTPAAPDIRALRELYEHYELRGLLRQLEGGEAPAADAGAGGTGADAQAAGGGAPTTPAAATAAATPGAAPGAAAAGAAPSAQPSEPLARRYQTITRWEDFERWLAALAAAELFAFDTETTTLDYMRAEIVGVSFCIEPGVAVYVPLRHVYPGVPEQLDRERVLAALKPLLEDPGRGKVGHNLKYDAHVLANAGIALAGMRFDSMLESYVWNSVATNHDMDSDAQRYLGLKTISYEEVTGRGARQISFDQVPVEKASEYAAEDADVTLRLHRALWAQLTSVPALARLYESCEQPLVPVLMAMEHHGVLVDRERLRLQSREFARQLQELLQQAHREAGHEFNIDSPRQLQQILFERLQLPVRRRTPTGQPSTAEDVLEELAESFPLPRIVLEYRALAKLKSTYTDKLPELVNERTGRIHTNYAQAVAATGRLSSVDPNLQNIPVRRPEGRRIRQAFIAPPGCVLVAADYSQIELRIMAHLSGDESLRAAFAADRDVHQATAAEVFGVELTAVTADQRRTAKVINFGLIYGMSPFGLARNLGIERGAAQQYVERYFQRYPGVKRFMDSTRAEARELGYVETVFGRRLYLPDIRSGNTQLRQYAERSAINAPMQGTAADIIKLAMIRVDEWCRRAGAPARLIMQVHDELVLEVRADAVADVSAAVRDHMVNAVTLTVPLRVDVGTGANWDEAH